MEQKHAWIIADGDNALFATFYYGKNLWGKDRNQAKIYEHKKEAEDQALKLDSKAYEVIIDPKNAWGNNFTVIEWSKW